MVPGYPVLTYAVALKVGTGSVLELYASTFTSTVSQPDSAVLVLLYNPHCPACQRVMGAFQQAAAALIGDTQHVVAQMDHTQNDIPIRGIRLFGYPTTYLFPADVSAPPKAYTASHYTSESLLAFLKGTEIPPAPQNM